MSTTPREVRRVVEASWGGQPTAVTWVGDRTLHSFWPVLAPYFRDVLLPPHRHDEEQVVAWQWAEVPGAPTPLELAALRQRLRRDGGIFAEAAEAGEAPSVGRERRNAAGVRELAPAVQRTVEQLAALGDPELADRVARTEHGLRLHSWGLARAAAAARSGVRGESGREDPSAADTIAPSGTAVARAPRLPARTRRLRWTIPAAAAVALLLLGAGGWRLLRSGPAAPKVPRTELATDPSLGSDGAARRGTLVHAGEHRDEPAAVRGAAAPAATVVLPQGSGPAARPGIRPSVDDAGRSAPDLPANRESAGGARDDEFESSREVTVARDTARAAPGMPAAGSAAVAAGNGPAGVSGAAAVAAGETHAPPPPATATVAGVARQPVADDEDPLRPVPPASLVTPRRSGPPVSPPAAIDAGGAPARVAQRFSVATIAASPTSGAAEAARDPAPVRGAAVSEDTLPPDPVTGAVANVREPGEAPPAGAGGESGGAARRTPQRNNVRTGGTPAAESADREAAEVAAADGQHGQDNFTPDAGRWVRWSVGFESAGVRQMRAVILPTLPSPDADGESTAELRERMRRELAASCPEALRPPRWRHGLVLAAPEGDTGSGWIWRTAAGTAATARVAVVGDRAVWEAPATGSDREERWTLADGAGVAQAEVVRRADGEVRVTAAPDLRLWQRFSLAAPASGGAAADGEFAWQTTSGGTLPPTCQVAHPADAPAGGWIELPLHGDRARVPDTFALVDPHTGWAALLRRRATPAEFTATR